MQLPGATRCRYTILNKKQIENDDLQHAEHDNSSLQKSLNIFQPLISNASQKPWIMKSYPLHLPTHIMQIKGSQLGKNVPALKFIREKHLVISFQLYFSNYNFCEYVKFGAIL